MNAECVNPYHGEVLADDTAVDLFPASGSRSLYLYSACTESLFMCSHNRETAACSACKGKTRTSGATTPWLIDSGASKRFTNCISDFVDYEPWSKARQQKLTTANGQSRIVGEGSVIIRAKNSSGKYRSVCLSHVQYVPDLTTRLLSLGTFLRSGMTVTGDGDRLILRHNNREYMVFEPRVLRDTLYGVNSKEFTEVTAMVAKTVNSVTYDTMHQRFAHPASEVLKHARKHTKGLPDVVPSPPGICPGCAKGKMANRSYPASNTRATAPFDLVHSDLKSYPIAGVHKNVYVVTFFDGHTSYAWIKFLKLKSDSVKALHQFIRLVKTQYGADIKRWRCDQGGEYLSKDFEDVLADHGIKLTPLPPYTPQVNGRAERFMQRMDEKAACMRHYAGTPNSWWEFAVEYAVHIYNLMPLQRHKWKTPHKALCKEKPTIDHLRVFDCRAYIFVPAKTRENKMAPKAELMTFVGWGSSGYKFVTRSGALRHQLHALFNESIFPRLKDTSTLQDVTRLIDAPNGDDTVVVNLPDIPIGPGDGKASQAPQLPPVQRTVFDSSDGSSESISAPVPGTGLPATPEKASKREDPVTPWTPYTRPSLPPQHRKNVCVETIAPDHDSLVQPLALRREPRDRKNITKPDNAWGESRPTLDKSIFMDFRLAVNDFEPTQKFGPSRPTEASRIPVRSPVPGPAPRSPVMTRLRQAVREAQPLPMPPLSSRGILLENIANLRCGRLRGGESTLDTSASHDASGVAKFAQDGGAPLFIYLLSLAEDGTKTVREWMYRDVLALPKAEREGWLGPDGAYSKELEALEKRNVFGPLVDLPPGFRAIGTRWVHNIKSDGCLKARLVAQGFSQREGFDFDEIFSPVVRFETVRILFALCAVNNWYITALDVRNAYLYGELSEEIYMQQPDGQRVKGQEHKVRRLLCALYGLQQAGLAWWRALVKSMVQDLGFTSIVSDAGIYVYTKAGDFVLAAVYVDDAIFCGPNKAVVL
jgi:hypothetical protein